MPPPAVKTIRDLENAVESRIQFATTIAIFFPSVVYGLSKIAGNSEQSTNETVLNLGIVIVAYIVDYVFFQILKSWMTEKWLKTIDVMTLIGIASFIVPILLIAVYKNETLDSLTLYSFAASLYISMAIPILIAGILIIFVLMQWMRDLFKKK